MFYLFCYCCFTHAEILFFYYFVKEEKEITNIPKMNVNNNPKAMYYFTVMKQWDKTEIKRFLSKDCGNIISDAAYRKLDEVSITGILHLAKRKRMKELKKYFNKLAEKKIDDITKEALQSWTFEETNELHPSFEKISDEISKTVKEAGSDEFFDKFHWEVEQKNDSDENELYPSFEQNSETVRFEAGDDGVVHNLNKVRHRFYQ